MVTSKIPPGPEARLFFLLLHSFQASVGFIDSNQVPKRVEMHFPGAAPARLLGR